MNHDTPCTEITAALSISLSQHKGSITGDSDKYSVHNVFVIFIIHQRCHLRG